jgi:hypothetical protein
MHACKEHFEYVGKRITLKRPYIQRKFRGFTVSDHEAASQLILKARLKFQELNTVTGRPLRP